MEISNASISDLQYYQEFVETSMGSFAKTMKICLRLLEANCFNETGAMKAAQSAGFTNNELEFDTFVTKIISGLNALMSNYQNENMSGGIKLSDLPKFEINLPKTNSDLKVGGGAFAGAAIGTAILPGIGTIIGGALGGFLGALFGPDINTLKEQVWQDVHPKIVEQYEKLRELATQSVIDCIQKLDQQSIDRMDAYVVKYNEKIDLLIKQDENEKESLERSKQSIESDKKMIMQYKDFLSVQG